MYSELSSLGKEEIALLSPAKVNLFFRVLFRRSDGYHQIASLYQAVNLFDEMKISISGSDDLLTCNDSEIPSDKTNLIFQALSVFRKKTNWHRPICVHLVKKIPTQAGLGGGSSNAATMLWGLNHLSGLNLPVRQLADWAAEFSSDASFFFSLGTSYCTGRGEVLENLPSLAKTHFWLAKPKEGLSTPLVYQHFKLRNFKRDDSRELLQAALREDLPLFNDLEQPAFELMPALQDLKQKLYSQGFCKVVMTGSGTAMMCFGPVDRPILEGVTFYPVSFLNRVEQDWYNRSLV